MGTWLTERTVEMIIVGSTMERQPVEPGVTHASPLSPILYVIYFSDLNECLDEYRSKPGEQSVLDNLG